MTNPHKHGISWRGGANGDVAPPLGGVPSGFGMVFSGFGFGVRAFEEEYTFFGVRYLFFMPIYPHALRQDALNHKTPGIFVNFWKLQI